MENIILELIRQPYGIVGVIVALLLLAFFITWKVSQWSSKFQNCDDHRAKAEEAHRQSFLALERTKDATAMSERITRIETKLDLIYTNTLGAKNPVASMSPISLTSVGIEIKDKLNADSILEKYISRLQSDIEERGVDNAYDIQMAAMEIAKSRLLSMLTGEEQAAVKQEAYNRGLLAEDIMSVYGVLLRDHILKSKGIPVSDVDAHQPS